MQVAAEVIKAAKPRKAASVAKTGPAPAVAAPAAVTDDDVFFARIAQLPADTPAASLERLYDLHAKTKADRARRAFDLAMIGLQPSLPVIAEKGKSGKGSYALFEDVIEAVRPVLAEHGFALTHRVEGANKTVRVTAILAHRDGHREETALSLPFDASDGKSDIHAEASAVSYGRRITSVSILGIVSRGEDDDAKRAGASQEIEMISPEQKIEILTLLADTGGDLPALLGMLKLASLEEATAAKVPLIKAEIRAAAKRQAKMKETAP